MRGVVVYTAVLQLTVHNESEFSTRDIILAIWQGLRHYHGPSDEEKSWKWTTWGSNESLGNWLQASHAEVVYMFCCHEISGEPDASGKVSLEVSISRGDNQGISLKELVMLEEMFECIFPNRAFLEESKI